MPSLAQRVLVVANPAAGLRGRGGLGERVVSAVRPHVAQAELCRTSAPGEAGAIARRAAEAGFDLVIAVGGDGTAHEVAQGIVGTGTALGVAPAGTMNLLARVLELPIDPVAAAVLLVRAGRRMTVHPGRAGARLFLLMAGVGLDAWVLDRLLGTGRKIRFRDYTLGAMTALARYPFPRIDLDADGVPLAGHSAIVGRAPLYGGFLRPTPGAGLDRDALDLCVFRGGPLALARVAASLWTGAHVGTDAALARPVRRVRASCAGADVPVQLDGEPAGRLPMTFDLDDRTVDLAH